MKHFLYFLFIVLQLKNGLAEGLGESNASSESESNATSESESSSGSGSNPGDGIMTSKCLLEIKSR